MNTKARITPACAGSRLSRTFTPCTRRDHPRMRGEQTVSGSFALYRPGSPPHARGAALELVLTGSSTGITPACAGSSELDAHTNLQAGDHPRMRGEQNGDSRNESKKPGSPPHARGAVFLLPAGCALFGITPACAGSRDGAGATPPNP